MNSKENVYFVAYIEKRSKNFGNFIMTSDTDARVSSAIDIDTMKNNFTKEIEQVIGYDITIVNLSQLK